tara:strand:+ start:2595 stop:2855 length:261 start_codon:yes stop_codon:yes gene_type:complete
MILSKVLIFMPLLWWHKYCLIKVKSEVMAASVLRLKAIPTGRKCMFAIVRNFTKTIFAKELVSNELMSNDFNTCMLIDALSSLEQD